MQASLNIEIARMHAIAERLPRRQFWIGDGLCSDARASRVTLMLYGEAALSLVRTQFAAGIPRLPATNPPLGITGELETTASSVAKAGRRL